jgi:polyphosphate kinase 2
VNHPDATSREDDVTDVDIIEEGPGEPADGGKPLKKKAYAKELERLQTELVKQQEWIRRDGLRVVVIFEGRDAAGKGGAIKRITQMLNPRYTRVSALPAPTDREKSQWYFQRYVGHLPAAGEMVIFDRSWYNRAGVERVMGFATEEEVEEFYRSCPEFERLLVRSGIKLIKYWFSVSDAEQEKRFQARIADVTKRWKLSPMDLHARSRWVDYSPRERRHVRPHRHPGGTMVGGGVGLEAARAAQLHQPPARRGPVPRSAGRDDRAAASPGGPGLRAAADRHAAVRPGRVLTPRA